MSLPSRSVGAGQTGAAQGSVVHPTKYQSIGGNIDDLWMCGDRVYERGTWAMSSVSKARKQPVAAYGSYFQIWRKTSPGQFKIEYLIFTLDFNPYDLSK